MEIPLVSVVIPCYRQAQWLPQALDTCLTQSYQSIEVIVVDDGSPDDVPGAVGPFGSRVRLIRQVNRGLAAARNAGLEAARGTFIKFLDADDWLLPHCLEHQVRTLQELPQHLAVCGHRFSYEGVRSPDEDLYPTFGKLAHQLCWLNPGPPAAYLFQAEILRTLGGFRSGVKNTGGKDGGEFWGHEDYDLLCRLAASGWEAVTTHTIGCVYRQTPASMSKNRAEMRRTRVQAWRAYVQRLLEGTPAPDLLVHIVGGYSQLVFDGNLRYEASELLQGDQGALNRLTAASATLPQASALALFGHLALLLKALRPPKNAEERALHDASLRAIGVASEKLAGQVRPGNSVPANLQPFFAFLNLADAQIGTGQSRDGRQHLKRALGLAPPRASVRRALNLYRFLARVLPGRAAAALWRALRAAYEAYYPSVPSSQG